MKKRISNARRLKKAAKLCSFPHLQRFPGQIQNDMVDERHPFLSTFFCHPEIDHEFSGGSRGGSEDWNPSPLLSEKFA